jgi:hypothetical protein
MWCSFAAQQSLAAATLCAQEHPAWWSWPYRLLCCMGRAVVSYSTVTITAIQKTVYCMTNIVWHRSFDPPTQNTIKPLIQTPTNLLCMHWGLQVQSLLWIQSQNTLGDSEPTAKLTQLTVSVHHRFAKNILTYHQLKVNVNPVYNLI